MIKPAFTVTAIQNAVEGRLNGGCRFPVLRSSQVILPDKSIASSYAVVGDEAG
jgi:hypothetical protein